MYASNGSVQSDNRPKEVGIALLHVMGTNTDVTLGSHLQGGLHGSDPIIRLTAARHADPLPKHVFCAHRFIASDLETDIDSTPPPLLLPELDLS
jgi:hypothetical protein